MRRQFNKVCIYSYFGSFCFYWRAHHLSLSLIWLFAFIHERILSQMINKQRLKWRRKLKRNKTKEVIHWSWRLYIFSNPSSPFWLLACLQLYLTRACHHRTWSSQKNGTESANCDNRLERQQRGQEWFVYLRFRDSHKCLLWQWLHERVLSQAALKRHRPHPRPRLHRLHHLRKNLVKFEILNLLKQNLSRADIKQIANSTCAHLPSWLVMLWILINFRCTYHCIITGHFQGLTAEEAAHLTQTQLRKRSLILTLTC